MFSDPRSTQRYLILLLPSDQFCSLAYSLSNLYFVGCFYTHYFVQSPLTTVPGPILYNPSLHASLLANVTSAYQPDSSAAKSTFQGLLSSAYEPRVQDAWLTCGGARNWGWYCLLGVSPLLVRFVQSLRRYRDSRLPTHLINVRQLPMFSIHPMFIYSFVWFFKKRLESTGWG